MREGGGSHFKNNSDLEKINFLFFPPSGSLFHWGCISFYYHFPFFKKKIMPCEIGSLTHLSSYVSVSQESGPCRLPPARGPCPAGPSGTPGFPPAPCRCPAGRQWCRALPREPWLVRPPCPALVSTGPRGPTRLPPPASVRTAGPSRRGSVRTPSRGHAVPCGERLVASVFSVWQRFYITHV